MVEKSSRGRQRASRAADEADLPQASEGKARAIVAPKKPSPAARHKSSGNIGSFPNLTARTPTGGYVQDDIVYSEEESDDDASAIEIKYEVPKRATGSARWRSAEIPLPTEYPLTDEAGDESYPSISEPALVQQVIAHNIDEPKSPEPVPTFSADKIAVNDSARPSNDSLLPQSFVRTPSNFIPQVSPTGTDAQRSDSSVERVNARLDAEDHDYAASATPAANEIPSQPQPQNQTAHRNSDRSQDTAPATSTRNTSTSRPRTGAEHQRRVKVAERWDWAPIEDDDEGNNSTNSISGTGTTRKHDVSIAGLGLTKA
jgi:hypothetical protein